MISLSATGMQGNGDSLKPSLSSDGRFVAFNSLASNLVPNDTNNTGDILIYDNTLGTLERILGRDGAEVNGSLATPNMSSDGRFIVFVGNASNLVSGDTNDYGDMFIYNRETATTQMISISFT